MTAASALQKEVFVSDWTPIGRHSLVGSFTLTFPNGLVILNCMLHRNPDGSERVAFPGAPEVSEGMVKYKAPGKIQYKTLIRFTSAALYRRLQQLILEELQIQGCI